MPDYPSTAAARPITMTSRRVPTFADAPGGFKLLATCPRGKSWRIDNFVVRNRSTTEVHMLTLYRLPLGWIGGTPNQAASDELYMIGPNEHFQPGQFHIFKMTVALGGGDGIWGFQIPEDGNAITWGLTLIVAGDEVG